MAQAGKRVLLVDADLRLPTQHAIFGVRHDFGLSTVLDGKATLDQAVQPTAVSGLEVLPCGPKPSNPSEMLNNPMFGELLEVVSERYDQVVIDSPPVMGIADARIIGSRVRRDRCWCFAQKNPPAGSANWRCDRLGSVGRIFLASSSMKSEASVTSSRTAITGMPVPSPRQISPQASAVAKIQQELKRWHRASSPEPRGSSDPLESSPLIFCACRPVITAVHITPIRRWLRLSSTITKGVIYVTHG